MTASNHALTGALLGLTLVAPLALPLAFISHFALDAIPHFSFSGSEKQVLRKRSFKLSLLLDASICFLIVIILVVIQPQHWLLASLCAFVATTPDLFWIKKFIVANRKDTIIKNKSWFLKLHHLVQWYQHPLGIIPELLWFIGFGYMFLHKV